MTIDAWIAVGAVALVVIAVALAVVAVAVVRSAREVPATLGEVREATRALREQTESLGPRLERLDQLADDAEETMAAARETLGHVDGVVRGPLDALGGFSKRLRDVGKGIEDSAERLRRKRGRTVVYSDDDEGADLDGEEADEPRS